MHKWVEIQILAIKLLKLSNDLCIILKDDKTNTFDGNGINKWED